MIFSTEDGEEGGPEGVDLSRIRDLREQKEAAQSEFNEISQRESEIQRKIDSLEDRADHVEREAKTEAVLPGEGAAEKALKTKSQEAQDLRQEAAELRTKKEEARQRLEAAKEELDAAVVEAIPEILTELEDQTEEHRSALRAFAEKTLVQARVLAEYREERAEMIDALNRLLTSLSDPDRRVNHGRKHRVRAAVKAQLEDPLKGEGLGLRLLELLDGHDIDALDEEPKMGGRLPLQRLTQ